eukprot:g59134.t1
MLQCTAQAREIGIRTAETELESMKVVVLRPFGDVRLLGPSSPCGTESLFSFIFQMDRQEKNESNSPRKTSTQEGNEREGVLIMPMARSELSPMECLPGLRASYRAHDGVLEIHGDQPDSIDVRKCEWGRGLYATRAFQKGELIYRGSYLIVKDDPKQRLEVHTNRGIYVNMDLETHSIVRFRTGTRELYGFDAFTNHSCEPNMYIKDRFDSEVFGVYDGVATRDIKAGEELLIDYDTIEWEACADGVKCFCKEKSCRGVAKGFRFLSPEDKIRKAPIAISEVRETWEVEERKLRQEKKRQSPPRSESKRTVKRHKSQNLSTVKRHKSQTRSLSGSQLIQRVMFTLADPYVLANGIYDRY